MAERSKALRSGRSLVLQAWVRIPLLTKSFQYQDLQIHGTNAEHSKEDLGRAMSGEMKKVVDMGTSYATSSCKQSWPSG